MIFDPPLKNDDFSSFFHENRAFFPFFMIFGAFTRVFGVNRQVLLRKTRKWTQQLCVNHRCVKDVGLFDMSNIHLN
jgi:hypothetical protein